MDSSGKTIGSANSSKPGGEVYILNQYLQKGTIPVFLEMSDKFFSIIKSHLANQDKHKEANNKGDFEMANSNQIDHAMSA